MERASHQLALSISAPALGDWEHKGEEHGRSGAAGERAAQAHSTSTSTTPATSTSSTCPFAQHWLAKRPVLTSCPKLHRRQLRLQNRSFTREELAQHCHVDDAWIAVDGKVYDITEHLVNHDGWGNAGVTTPLSILAHAGTECSAEFHAIHRTIPVAYKQLAAFFIGPLADY